MLYFKGNLPYMERISTAIILFQIPILLDFIALEDLGDYKIDIQSIQLTGALCTSEIYDKIREGFQENGLDVPEILSAYGLTELDGKSF